MQEANSKVIEKMDSGSKAAKADKIDGKKVVNFVGDVKLELKKVEWTSKDELIAYTKIVLASTFLFGLFIYLIDLGIRGVLGGINLIISALFG